MKLFVLRHGHAEAYAESDRQRNLSPKGELEVHSICQAHYSDLKNVEQIFYSPYLRTKQTAEITEQYLTAPREQCDLLVPNGRLDQLVEFLYGAQDAYESVLIVSHQPLVGMLVDSLGGFEAGRFRMGTASLAHFDCNPIAASCCSLNWLKHPSC